MNMASTTIFRDNVTESPSDGHGFDDPGWLITTNIIIGTCGFMGNSVVVVVFLLRAKKTFKNWTQMYILHQSSIDSLASFVFLLLRFFNDSGTLAPGGTREVLLCKVWFSEYLLWSLFMVSTYNLTLVALERFLAVVKPIFHRNQMTRKRVLISMCIPWMWAFAFQSYWPPIYALYGTECYPEWPQKWLQPFFGVLTFLFEYFLPLVVMLTAYGFIIHKLKGMSDRKDQHAVRMAGAGANGSHAASTMPPVSTVSNASAARSITTKPAPKEVNIYSTAKRNVIKTLLAVTTVYVLSWTPTEIEFLLYNLGVIEIDFSGAIYRMLSLLVLANMIANPIIYAGFYKDFQQSLRSATQRCRSNRVDAAEETAATDSRPDPEEKI